YDFNNTGIFDITGSASSAATLPAALLAHSGSHVIHGRITDAFGGFTDYTTTINVSDVAPTVAAGPDQSVPAGVATSLGNVTFSDPGYDTPGHDEVFTASIDWGDGSTSVGLLTETPGGPG